MWHLLVKLLAKLGIARQLALDSDLEQVITRMGTGPDGRWFDVDVRRLVLEVIRLKAIGGRLTRDGWNVEECVRRLEVPCGVSVKASMVMKLALSECRKTAAKAIVVVSAKHVLIAAWRVDRVRSALEEAGVSDAKIMKLQSETN